LLVSMMHSHKGSNVESYLLLVPRHDDDRELDMEPVQTNGIVIRSTMHIHNGSNIDPLLLLFPRRDDHKELGTELVQTSGILIRPLVGE
jgi:hypothetical protein